VLALGRKFSTSNRRGKTNSSSAKTRRVKVNRMPAAVTQAFAGAEERIKAMVGELIGEIEATVKKEINRAEFINWVNAAAHPRLFLRELSRMPETLKGREFKTDYFMLPEFLDWRFYGSGFARIDPIQIMRKKLEKGGSIVVYTSQRFSKTIVPQLESRGFTVDFTPVAEIPHRKKIRDPALKRLFRSKNVAAIGELTITLASKRK